MAEPTNPPSLPSTADAVPYVPVSWLAVAADTVAGSFALTLLALGTSAFVNKKPLLEDWLLALPAVAIVLSFAARRVIRNSEGTRTGENLANYAWWVSVVLGLCYIAYLFAIDFAIRRDARGEVERWVGLIEKGTENDLDAALLRASPPSKRQGISLGDKFLIRTRLRNEEIVFRTCDLVQLIQRNKGEVDFTPGGVTWTHRPGQVDCVLNGTLKCPEGIFPIIVPLQGMEGVTGPEGGGGGRQWSIVKPITTGFIDNARAARTEYGWSLAMLQADGAQFGKAFVNHMAPGPTAHPYLYRGFIAPGSDPGAWAALALGLDPNGPLTPQMTTISHLAFVAPVRVALGDAGYADYMANQFYKKEGGGEPTADQKKKFFETYNVLGLRPAGDRLKDPGGGAIDKEDVITVTDTAIEVRVPVEIPVIGSGKMEASRGRLLVVCNDRTVIEDLKKLKGSANSAVSTLSPPEGMSRRIAWRVVRVESDMLPVNALPSRNMDMPQPPG